MAISVFFLLIGIVALGIFLEWFGDRGSRASAMGQIRGVAANVTMQTLQQNYTSLVNMGLALPIDRAAETNAKFIALATNLRPHFSNWSKQGFLEMSKRVAGEARADQHLDKSSAISKGLIAVWLECHARDHPIANLIKIDLDNIIAAHESANSANDPARHKANAVGSDLAMDSYGYTSDQPIQCPDIVLSKVYLSTLRHKGNRVQCKRLEAIRVGGKLIDVYEVVGTDNFFTKLYVDAHASNSALHRAPSGFTMAEGR